MAKDCGVKLLPTVSTIGFTKTTAKNFFERLAKAGVRKVLDVRLHNNSQLSGFAKETDLSFFLNRLGGIEYAHEPLLAPTETLLKSYQKKGIDWSTYETRFLALMAERKIEEHYRPKILDGACLLCSEAKPHQCHRRLVCEYLNEKWQNALEVEHL